MGKAAARVYQPPNRLATTHFARLRCSVWVALRGVALDPRHQTHNIPGKFLSCMQAGLPVLASINPGKVMTWQS
jgi:hypothetical protein